MSITIEKAIELLTACGYECPELTEREKQIVMLRRVLKDVQAVAESSMKTHGYDKHHMQNISTCREALSAPQDLSGYILCDAEPIWVAEDVVEKQMINGRPRKVWWECDSGVGTPLCKARKP